MTRTLNSNCQRAAKCKETAVKFLYSYDGQILPRRSDGCLRYVGGYTRVLSVDRSISFADLMVKFGELCGFSIILKCKLPDEDLDVLISIKSDEDLKNIIGEYDRVVALTNQEMKIRAVLFPISSLKTVSSPPSPIFPSTVPKFQPSRFSGIKRSPSQPSMSSGLKRSPSQPSIATYRCCSPPAVGYSTGARREAIRTFCCRHENPMPIYYAASYPRYLH